mmetsp:Transcript_24457/g.42800  ORF Transcript_24457/g.42800 Transcript_24457/m.42800 type:complete len:110 (-) Transcript_24457:59-388(-)
MLRYSGCEQNSRRRFFFSATHPAALWQSISGGGTCGIEMAAPGYPFQKAAEPAAAVPAEPCSEAEAEAAAAAARRTSSATPESIIGDIGTEKVTGGSLPCPSHTATGRK